jgi:drug/metabolite transporter (DMT)-like permease
MQATPEILIGSLVGLIGTALYGFSVVVYQSQSEEIKPIAISSIKMWIALPFMALMVLAFPGIQSILLPIGTILILGISVVFGAVVGDTIYLWSQERIGVSYAFPISMSFPIITYFLAVLFLNEHPVLSRLAGAIIAVVGVIVISNEQSVAAKDSEDIGTDGTMKKFDLWGFAGALATAVLYAVGTVLLQVGIAGVDPIGGSFIRVLFGSVVFVPVVALASLNGMKLPTRKATIRVIIAGFFGMAVGSLLYVIAVAEVGATIMSVISSTAPLYAIPVSLIFLKEKLTRLAAVGIVATLVGVVLVVIGF